MSSEDRALNNRTIAEWIEPRPKATPTRHGCLSPLGMWQGYNTGANFVWKEALTRPDFYRSEEASALVLEKMPAAELYKHPPDRENSEAGWRCRPDWGLDFAVYNVDRKTAIAEAALALIRKDLAR